MFHAVLNSMEKIRPNIRTIVYGKRPSLTVITKVPCCNASPKDLGTSPHYDKSAPSLILDHDDLEKENLVLSAQHHPFHFTRLPSAKRVHLGTANGSLALCTPGSFLKASGTTIAPTAYAVLPFHRLYTQSLLLP
jgi:hypothetical protein